MTAVAAFEVLTDLDVEAIKSKLLDLWIGKQVNVRLNQYNNFTTCILEYIFNTPVEEKSIRDVVNYLLMISNNGWIYYYPDLEVYDMSDSDDDEAMEISVDDIFKEEYQPSLNSPFGYARFIIKKQLNT
jgi:hypothetical protein